MSSKYENPIFVELYEQFVTETDDVECIKRIIGDRTNLQILECFSGSGRILIPLAEDGHVLTGIEGSMRMQQKCREKAAYLDPQVQSRIRLLNGDVFRHDWGVGYDFIILGGNCFYELPSAELQETLISKAYEALTDDGLLFIDHDDYKGNWGNGEFTQEIVIFEWVWADGTEGKATLQHDSFDEDHEILYMRNKVYTIPLQGAPLIEEYEVIKHPVRAVQVQDWLTKYGFQIEHVFGDRSGTVYSERSKRAIFLARK